MNPVAPESLCAACGGATALSEPEGAKLVAGVVEFAAFVLALPLLSVSSLAFAAGYLAISLPAGMMIARWIKRERHRRCVSCGAEVPSA
ncbi:MAG: hypothetical protein ABI411_00560 [Tahibacter sp.]